MSAHPLCIDADSPYVSALYACQCGPAPFDATCAGWPVRAVSLRGLCRFGLTCVSTPPCCRIPVRVSTPLRTNAARPVLVRSCASTRPRPASETPARRALAPGALRRRVDRVDLAAAVASRHHGDTGPFHGGTSAP